MGRYILKRLLMTVFVIVISSAVIFTLVYFVPGDPARVMLGAAADEDEIARLNHSLGLDDSYFVQLGRFMYNAFIKLDLGTSWIRGTGVVDGMLQRLPYTLIMGIVMVSVSALIGIPLGVLAAIHRNHWQDRVATSVAMFCISVPDFWLALMMIRIFSLKLGWLPSFGAESFTSYIMPVIAGAINGIGTLERQTRSSMLEVIRSDFVVTARAKGLKESVVVYKHMLKNALIPVLTVLGAALSKCIAGVVIIEQIFSLPGIGTYLTSGIGMRDYPIIRGCVIVLAIFIALLMLLVDLAYAAVDPRIKAQYAGQKKFKKHLKRGAA